MSNSIPILDGNYINHGILINIYVNGVNYNIASSYNSVSFDGLTYTGLGDYLSIGDIQDDIKATNNTISVGLSGVPSYVLGDANLLSLVLTQQIKGSRIIIKRAFFNRENREIINAYTRFNGYVSNFSLSENIDAESRTSTNSIILQCSSIHGVIEKQISGRRTNPKYFGTDTSMYRVTAIADRPFDFGKPFVGNSNAAAPSAGAGGDTAQGTVDTAGFTSETG
jgi:hypothetical protein